MTIFSVFRICTCPLLILLIKTTTIAQCIEGNCVQGIGTFKYPSGARYSGNFENNKIHGTGTLYFGNGDIYSGNWINNYRDGKGKYIFATGDLYKGEFKKSKFEGKGMMNYADGKVYDGQWKDNLPHGAGKYLYANGEQYEGNFKSGKRHGHGRMVYQDGSTYEGQWENDTKEGIGVLVTADNKKRTGVWQSDEFIKEEKFNSQTLTQVFPDETKNKIIDKNQLIDCNKNHCDAVHGMYVFKDGSKYIGPFKNGNPYGSGIVYYANGDRYEGEWNDIAPEGRGIMYFANGRVYAAIWDHGRSVKQLDNRLELPKRNDIKIYKDSEIKIWPVIIGIAQYAHMPVLRFSDDDAYRLLAFLKSPEGGAIPDQQIKLLIDEDATRENIIDALQEQFGRADENDMVMLYYSGHGINGSLLPINFDGFNNKLYHDEIVQIMESSKAKHKLCLIDACYAGSMQEVKSDFITGINNFYGRLNQERGGTAMILSCKEREVSLEDSGLRQGIFSHYLMKGLKGMADKNNNKVVSIIELFEFIKGQVSLYTGNIQNPILEGNYNPNMPVAWIRN